MAQVGFSMSISRALLCGSSPAMPVTAGAAFGRERALELEPSARA